MPGKQYTVVTKFTTNGEVRTSTQGPFESLETAQKNVWDQAKTLAQTRQTKTEYEYIRRGGKTTSFGRPVDDCLYVAYISSEGLHSTIHVQDSRLGILTPRPNEKHEKYETHMITIPIREEIIEKTKAQTIMEIVAYRQAYADALQAVLKRSRKIAEGNYRSKSFETLIKKLEEGLILFRSL